MRTLLLDTVAWDCVTDIRGNWAVADDPYAIAQNVASAVRLFKQELWYDVSQGIPYFEQILGKWPPIALVQQYVVNAALTVPEVVEARVVNISLNKRTLTGAVEIIDTTGATQNVQF